MLPCRMFCESKPCIGGSNEFVFESTAHPKLRIFAVLCFRFPIWLFGSGTGQLSAVNCRIWWPKLYFYIRIKLLVRSDKLGKGVTCPSVTTTRLRRSDVSYAEHWTMMSLIYCFQGALQGLPNTASIMASGLDISQSLDLPSFKKRLIIFKPDYAEFIRKLVRKPLAWFTILLAPGCQAMGYIKPYAYTFYSWSAAKFLQTCGPSYISTISMHTQSFKARETWYMSTSNVIVSIVPPDSPALSGVRSGHLQTQFPQWSNRHAYLLRLPWIYLGVPLEINGAPRNTQGNLTALIMTMKNNDK